MNEKEILRIFKEKGALLSGHFKLSSGLHSDKYLQCALVLQYPDLAETLCKELLRKFEAINYKQLTTNAIVSPAIGGIVLGQEMARLLGTRAIFCERQDGKLTLRRGFRIKKEERVLVVEDVLTTGSSVKEVMEVVRKHGGRVMGVATLVDRSERVKFNVPFVSLVKLRIKNYKPEECPLCKQDLSLVKPGSR